jgi:hypothetical protein
MMPQTFCVVAVEDKFMTDLHEPPLSVRGYRIIEKPAPSLLSRI